MNAAVAPAVAPRPRLYEKVVIVTRRTQLEELAQRFNTAAQARFYLEHAGEDFAPIEADHAAYHRVLDGIRGLVPRGMKRQVIDRAFLPQFSFGESDLVVTVGPDGLVVNTAKYLAGQPINYPAYDVERLVEQFGFYRERRQETDHIAAHAAGHDL